MREHDRKWGRVVRYEHGRVVRVEEAGEAIESAELFLAAPIAERVALPAVAEEAVLATARAIEALVTPERLLVSEGVAAHECNGVRWQERTRRVHLAFVFPRANESEGEGTGRMAEAMPLLHTSHSYRSLATLGMTGEPAPPGRRGAQPLERALIDLDSFDLDVLRRIAQATPAPGRSVERVRFAPHVAAALLPHLIGRIELEQLPAPHDGKGLPVERCAVEGEPPNWYRPSYRVRPRRAWLNLRAPAFDAIDGGAPEAIALLGPIDVRAQRLLCIAGGELFPATVAIML